MNEKMLVVPLCFLGLFLIFGAFTMFVGMTQNYDVACQKIGFSAYIDRLNACIDKDGKLYFIKGVDSFIESLTPFHIPKFEVIGK